MKKRLSIFIILVFITSVALSQKKVAPNKYLIQFKDKQYSQYSIQNPIEFLTQRAIDRKNRLNISIDERDFPVCNEYIDSIKMLGINIHCTSKWFNSAVVEVNDTAQIIKLSKLQFIDFEEHVTALPELPMPNIISYVDVNKYWGELIDFSATNFFNYGESANQIEMLAGHLLHNQGFTGKGVLIAILDGGFQNVNNLAGFTNLFANEQIKGTFDFVDKNENVYDVSTHGTKVLSTMAGYIENQLVGTAPDADYWLFRTEDGGSEYPIEEENWIAAAERADSLGVDIINTSLGYSKFDDVSMSYTYTEMDGETTRISRAANMAVRKGVFVITSAGNEGNSEYRHITAPADAKNILAVGAVNDAGEYATFSSIGPSADGRIKPNVAAQGQIVIVHSSISGITNSNGTSFSSPIIAGMVACLMQANEISNLQQLQYAVERSSHLFHSPDKFYGYGIPNFALANLFLKSTKNYEEFQSIYLSVHPNPFHTNLNIEIVCRDENELILELFDLCGKKLICETIQTVDNEGFFSFNNLNNLKSGIYILRISSDKTTKQIKILKN